MARPTYDEMFPTGLRCRVGLHKWRWVFVGSSWQPDDYVHICIRCQREF